MPSGRYSMSGKLLPESSPWSAASLDDFEQQCNEESFVVTSQVDGIWRYQDEETSEEKFRYTETRKAKDSSGKVRLTYTVFRNARENQAMDESEAALKPKELALQISDKTDKAFLWNPANVKKVLSLCHGKTQFAIFVDERNRSKLSREEWATGDRAKLVKRATDVAHDLAEAIRCLNEKK